MKRPVDVATAAGAGRNFLYALHVCNGYNPRDSVFWGLMKSPPPSDRAWSIVASDIIARHGATVDIPADILDQQ
jgi:hypothetical protein